MRTIFFYLLIILCPIFVHAGEFFVYEHIVLTQDITVAASRLCQDGQNIYFTSKLQCEKAKGLYSCDGEWCEQTKESLFSCGGDLKIAPIRSVETIYMTPGGKNLTRFYEINTEFKYEEYQDNNGKMGGLLLSEKRKLPLCAGMRTKGDANIRSSRLAKNEEKELLGSLIDAGYSLINTPHGNIHTIRNLTNPDKINHDITKVQKRFQTPFCNSEISDDQIWKMSGEYTGNGVFQVNNLQAVSKAVFIEKIHYQADPNTGEIKKAYDFTCTPTWEI